MSESLPKNVAGLKACNFIKKRPTHRCFPVNIEKFVILLNSKNNCERLLFDFFNGSLLHWPKGSRFRLYDCIRLSCFYIFCIFESLLLTYRTVFIWIAFSDYETITIFFQTIKCCCQVHVQATSLFKIISVGIIKKKKRFYVTFRVFYITWLA